MSVTVYKASDIGRYWHPIGADGGSICYAGSFDAPASGPVIETGCMFEIYTINPLPFQEVRYDICGALSGDPANGPDTSDVYASSDVITLGLEGSLTQKTSTSMTSYTSLTSSQTYFFVVTTVGLDGNSNYYVGGHTRNSGGISDDGLFWYSNDGSTFSSNSTYEMGFNLTIDGNVAGKKRRWVHVFE